MKDKDRASLALTFSRMLRHIPVAIAVHIDYYLTNAVSLFPVQGKMMGEPARKSNDRSSRG